MLLRLWPFFLYGSFAYAGSVATVGDAFNAGKEFGSNGKTVASGQVNSKAGSANLPYYSTSAPQSSYFRDGKKSISADATSRQAECLNTKSTDSFKQQECDAINFLSKNSTSRPKYTIKKDDPLLVGSASTISNPGTIPGASNQSCTVQKTTVPATYTTQYCYDSQTIGELSCSKKLVVTCNAIDADISKILTDWKYGGDMHATISVAGTKTYGLDFGCNVTRHDGQYDSPLTFNISDISKLTAFTLNYVGYDDWLWVKVNESTVYVGPFGGTKIEYYSGSYQGWCSRRDDDPYPCTKYVNGVTNGVSNYSFIDYGQGTRVGLSIDVLPLLKTGSNTIWMRNIVGGNGDAGIRFTIETKAGAVCTDSWNNDLCDPLDARVK